MDAPIDSSLVPGTDAPRALIGTQEIRSILSNLSHELCRPLVSLRMGFDLLLADSARPISAEQRDRVNTMMGLCDDLLLLTRSYLDYAGLVQGTRPLCYGTFTVGALIREIDRQFGQAAAARRIALDCRLEGADTTVTTDASRCQHIFGNLVANALKYTPEAGKVHVAGRVEGDWWTVTVGDNGPGIPVEHVERVFEPFYRLSRDENSRAEGNGLGLAICREMVGQLGGEISLWSGVGQGTRVTVRFPVQAAPEAVPPEPRR